MRETAARQSEGYCGAEGLWQRRFDAKLPREATGNFPRQLGDGP